MDTIIQHPASLRARSVNGLPAMPASTYATPREVMEDTGLSPAGKREILAFWASDACAVDSRPELRQPPGAPNPVPYDEIRRALHELDGLGPDWPPSGAAAVRRGPGVEPSVADMLADPIVRLVMLRDGVSDQDVYRAMAHAGLSRGRLGRVAWRG
ncbi:hypothetical protein [Emcibacter sp. SYSU 3D8]|uniref:hypothetical protein n=1 Tax=Emcibacter sp. SYSU 3D8 TaxID=3133969 RepID=UPI0031FE9124